MLWKGTTITIRSYLSFPIRWFCISFAPTYHEGIFRWWQYSRAKFFSYKWFRAQITIKNSFGLLKACFWFSKRVMDKYTSSSFISLFNITQQFRVTEGKNSRTEPCVSLELWETSTTCDKQFIIQRIFEWKGSHKYLLILISQHYSSNKFILVTRFHGENTWCSLLQLY